VADCDESIKLKALAACRETMAEEGEPDTVNKAMVRHACVLLSYFWRPHDMMMI
jgi:hypothetical protein